MNVVENLLNYEDYCTLRQSVGWNNFKKEQVLHVLKNNVYSIVVYEDEKAIGMGRLLGDGMYFTIVDVVVHPIYQRRGIGHFIIKQILKYVDKHTQVGWKSSVQLIAERGKEPFYETLGFQKLPHVGAGCGMQKLIEKLSGQSALCSDDE